MSSRSNSDLGRMFRREAIENGTAPPTIREADISRRAKNTLKKLGYEANQSMLQIREGYSRFLDVDACGPKTAMELSKFISKVRRQFNGETKSQ